MSAGGPTGAEPEDDGAIDTGLPIAELAGLREEPSARFIDRVRGSVHRRTFSAELVRYAWTTPFLVLFEYVKIVFDSFSGKTTQDREND